MIGSAAIASAPIAGPAGVEDDSLPVIPPVTDCETLFLSSGYGFGWYGGMVYAGWGFCLEDAGEFVLNPTNNIEEFCVITCSGASI